MSIANQVEAFLKSTNQDVFIEAEGKEDAILNFIEKYNNKYSESIDVNDEGIILLEEDANKWGIELRCYFDNAIGVPDGVKVTQNTTYRADYRYRINDVGLIWELFDLGYRIGKN